jgi:predicted membrane protein
MARQITVPQGDPAQRNVRRAAFGLSIIGIGALALLDNLHVFDFPLLRTFWPLLFVIWGIGRLAWPYHPGSRVFGLVLTLIGALMTAHNLGHADFDIRQWWPVFIILAGASIALRGAFPWTHLGRPRLDPSAVEHADALNIDATFGSVELRNDSRAFKGGRIAVSFGSAELDLTEAVMDGPEVTIEVHASFGGVELRVPRDWQVIVQVRATMGSVEDRSAPPSAPAHRLILRGDASFGGVEIRN